MPGGVRLACDVFLGTGPWRVGRQVDGKAFVISIPPSGFGLTESIWDRGELQRLFHQLGGRSGSNGMRSRSTQDNMRQTKCGLGPARLRRQFQVKTDSTTVVRSAYTCGAARPPRMSALVYPPPRTQRATASTVLLPIGSNTGPNYTPYTSQAYPPIAYTKYKTYTCQI